MRRYMEGAAGRPLADLAVAVGNGVKGLTRFLPEPKSRLGRSFGAVLQSVGSAIAGVGGGVASSVNPEYMELINKQIEVQQQLLQVSLVSNVEKSKHETQMAAVRNVRAA